MGSTGEPQEIDNRPEKLSAMNHLRRTVRVLVGLVAPLYGVKQLLISTLTF